MSWKKLVYITLSQFQYHKEFETINIELRPLAERLVSISPEHRSLASILNSFYQYHSECKQETFERWGDKTPANVFALDLIFSVFPKAQFIHIIRDGCDVVSSYVDSGIYQNYQDAAIRWISATNSASNFIKRHSGIGIEIKYEDLVSDPKGTIVKICDFLEVNFEDSILQSESHASKMGDVSMRSHHQQVFKKISTSNIGKGRSRFSHDEKKTMQQIMGTNLAKFGYKSCFS